MSAGTATLLLEDSGDQTVDGFEYRQVWQVLTTSASDDGSVVLTAPGLPPFGASFAADPQSRVYSRRPIRQNEHRYWHVEISFRREKQNEDDKQNPPTLRRIKRSADVKFVEKALMFALSDEIDDTQDQSHGPVYKKVPIVTSAQTPFDPPLTTTVAHTVARFQRWEDSFTTATQRKFVHKCNSKPFGAFKKWEVLCTNISAMDEWEQDANGDLQLYWLVTYEFEHNPDGWRPLKVLDQDIWFVDHTNDNNRGGKRVPIYVDSEGNYGGPELRDTDANAIPVPKPVPIRPKSGSFEGAEVIPASELLADPTIVHYLEFNTIDEVDFDELNLNVN